MAEQDLKNEDEGLKDEETRKQKDLLSEYWRLARLKESLLC